MKNASRFGRWILPTSAMSLAVGALAFLVALEVEAPPGAPPPPTASRVTGSDDALHETRLAALPSAPSPTPSSWRELSRRPRAQAQEEARHARARQRARVRAAHGEVPQANRLISRLAGASLAERLTIVDELAAGPKPVKRLTALLEGHLPGTPYETQTVRIAIISRLGQLEGADAEQVLVAHLDPDRPRPQRLAALNQIAARHLFRPAELRAIADQDHDRVVQDRARRVLGYQ